MGRRPGLEKAYQSGLCCYSKGSSVVFCVMSGKALKDPRLVLPRQVLCLIQDAFSPGLNLVTGCI